MKQFMITLLAIVMVATLVTSASAAHRRGRARQAQRHRAAHRHHTAVRVYGHHGPRVRVDVGNRYYDDYYRGGRYRSDYYNRGGSFQFEGRRFSFGFDF